MRFPIAAIGLLLMPLSAQAAPITFDISGTARTESSAFGIDAGDQLTGSLTIDDSVRHGEGETGDVSAFEFRVGNTTFDMDGGNFEASYELRSDGLYKVDIHAKPQAFRHDKRLFLLNLAPHDVTLKLKDLGNDWVYVDNIVIERPRLFTPPENFNSTLSTVAEPASVPVLAMALGLLAVSGLRRRAA